MDTFIENELTLALPDVGKSSEHLLTFMWFVYQVTLNLPPATTQGVGLVQGVGLRERWGHLLLTLLGNLRMCGLLLAAYLSICIELLLMIHICVLTGCDDL